MKPKIRCKIRCNITGAISLFLNITGAIAPVAPVLNTPLCWFLGKNLFNSIPPVWKLHNPYCHNAHRRQPNTNVTMTRICGKLNLRTILQFKFAQYSSKLRWWGFGLISIWSFLEKLTIGKSNLSAFIKLHSLLQHADFNHGQRTHDG